MTTPTREQALEALEKLQNEYGLLTGWKPDPRPLLDTLRSFIGREVELEWTAPDARATEHLKVNRETVGFIWCNIASDDESYGVTFLWRDKGFHTREDAREVLETAAREWLNALAHEQQDGRIARLVNLRDIQSSQGNFDVDEYMRGLANGLILAVATMRDEEPVFHKAATPQQQAEPVAWPQEDLGDGNYSDLDPEVIRYDFHESIDKALSALEILHTFSLRNYPKGSGDHNDEMNVHTQSVADALRAAQARIDELEGHLIEMTWCRDQHHSNWQAEKDRATKAKAQLARAIEVMKDFPRVPDSFKFTGTSGHDLENVFDNELRHESGKKPADYLFGWLPMFRPFAYATRDDSWGELEKLICTTLRNYVQVLDKAAAFITEYEKDVKS